MESYQSKRTCHLLLIIFSVVVFGLVVVKGICYIARGFADNDEGIYLTTFILRSQGYRLYREIFFSQLPGFFLFIYPFFNIFGKSLTAARLAVFIWSLFGFISLIWFFNELKQRWLGIMTIILLLLSHTFIHQITVLQSDGLIFPISIIGLFALNRYL